MSGTGLAWTGWFSEEGTAAASCPSNKIVYEIQCSGRYCDNMTLLCGYVKSGFKIINSSRWTMNGFFSEEHNGYKNCPSGYYLYGLKCNHDYCDNIQLRCVKVQYSVNIKLCKPISIQQSSTSNLGTVKYSKTKEYNTGYPVNTVATFKCNQNHPFGYDITTKCTNSGWDRNIAHPFSRCDTSLLEVEPYMRLPRSYNQCPKFMFLSKEDCADAGLAVGGTLRNGKLLEGSWGHLPFGCLIYHEGDAAIYYNSRYGRNDGRWESVCSRGSLTLFPKSFTGGCPPSMDFSTSQECAAAGLTAGGRLLSGSVAKGSWDHLPSGCSILQSNGGIYYNSNSTGVNNGDYSSLCHELPVSNFNTFLAALLNYISYSRFFFSFELLAVHQVL